MSDTNTYDLEPVDLAVYEEKAELVSGQVISENRFVTTMKMARLARLVSNPLSAYEQKDRESSQRLSDYFEVHQEIQREFNKGKRSNARDYAQYIVEICNGADGDTPTIDFYTAEALDVIQGLPGSLAKIAIPYGTAMVPYDGETQLAARFLAGTIDRKTLNMMVPITITHGKPPKYARQCFRDRNYYQHRASVGMSMSMDGRDPMIAAIRSLETNVPDGFKKKISWKGRQIPAGGGYIAAASYLRTAMLCFAHGIAGIQLKTGDLPKGIAEEEFNRRATIWFGRLVQKTGSYMVNRKEFVTSSPAIWAALGALGHPLISADPDDVDKLSNQLIDNINNIDWSVGDHWVGIAIKASAKPGKYSFAGGAKDSGTIASKAISDPSDPNYSKIRK